MKTANISNIKYLNDLNEKELDKIKEENRMVEQEQQDVDEKRDQVVQDLGSIIRSVRDGKIDEELLAEY